jgi:tetratricopeptide (TPR) repeat protein
MSELFSNIKLLEHNLIKQFPRYNFNRYIDIEEIETLEKALSIKFPPSYRQFLNKYNGGMILEFDPTYYIDMTEWEPDNPKNSSYYFHTIYELKDEYSDFKYANGMFSEDFDGVFPLIPICTTPNQQIILLVSQKELEVESPVFIATDPDDMNTYIQIAESFNAFLGKYIKHNGFPPLPDNNSNKLLSIFISDHNVVSISQEKESLSDVIERTSALMKLYPSYDWNYVERGNAYKDVGKRKLALNDYNRAIEMCDNNAFTHYCRGDLLFDYGSARKSIIDLDIAVKLEPSDKLYLSTRAMCFLKLKKLDKALTDCNKVLEIDPVYEIALATRYQVYGEMGDFEKADADSKLLDELYRK